jgi:glyoxylase-like metal-dependent hydrolase (beta-lactamase superfamily II)
LAGEGAAHVAAAAPVVAGARQQASPTARTLSRAQAGYYHFRIGAVDVTALSDGTLSLEPHTLLTNTTPSQVKARLAEDFQDSAVDISVNAYLIEAAGRLILVDAGTGELFGPTLDKLPASIRAMGYQPEQITDILITHIHTDHTGGLTHGAAMVYPNATVHVAQQELDYWLSADNRRRAPEAKRKDFDEARAKLTPYLNAGRVRPFNGATQLFPGVRTIPSPGHTPGHSFFALDSEGETLVFWGDLLHIAEVQMPHPEVTIAFDIDPSAARRQRELAFADAAKHRYMVAPAHLSFPGTGHVRVDGAGYRWVPTTYRNDAVSAQTK